MDWKRSPSATAVQPPRTAADDQDSASLRKFFTSADTKMTGSATADDRHTHNEFVAKQGESMTNRLMEAGQNRVEEIVDRIAKTLEISPAMVLPFVDSTDCLAELLHHVEPVNGRILAAGHVTPDVALAAHRAKVEMKEILGASPFCGDLESLLREVISEYDVIYLANPSRITGANFSLADLEAMAKAVPSGRLIIDEYYFDFYGITGIALIKQYSNVVVLRSFTAAFGIGSAESGYLVAAPATVVQLQKSLPPESVSMTLYRIITTVIENAANQTKRLTALHDESLRLATVLTRLGVQCRLTATDFLLMRVASPTEVGNYLGRFRAPIEDLSGYPEMGNYIRYKLQSEFSNNNLLKGFEKIPPGCYKMSTPDRRAVRLRHSGDTTVASKLMPANVADRHRVLVAAKQ